MFCKFFLSPACALRLREHSPTVYKTGSAVVSLFSAAAAASRIRLSMIGAQISRTAEEINLKREEKHRLSTDRRHKRGSECSEGNTLASKAFVHTHT